MVRLFASIGFSYLIALVASVYFGTKIAIVLAIVFLCLFVISLFFKVCRNNKVVSVVLITISLAFANYSISYFYKVKPIESLEGSEVDVSGVICDTPYKSYNKYYYVIETDSVNAENAPQKIKLRISSNISLDADVYDRVTGKITMFSPNSNKGFSSKTYYASKNIHMFAYFSNYGSVEIKETDDKPLNYYILKLKEELISRIQILLGNEESAIATGMLLGYRYNISDEIKTEFNHTGVSHLMAVSGYHVATIVSLMFILFNILKLPKRTSNILGIVGVLFFMAITGFSSSVMRAGIMYIIYLFGQMISKKSDSVNSLGIAVFIICVLNPFSGGDIGLLLSVSATLGIIILSPVLSLWLKDKITDLKFGKRYLNPIFEAIAVTLSANIFTLPITMISFKYFYPISLLSNLLIIFAFSAMFVFLIISIILSYITFFNIFAIPLSIITTLLIKYMVWCVETLEKIPFSRLSADYRFLLLWLSGSMILLAIAINFKNNLKLIKFTAILSSIVLIVGTLSYQILNRGITTVAVLSVGDGVSSIISKDGRAAVISCGGNSFYANKIYEYLESKNIRKIDFVLATDDNTKTSDFIDEILEEFNPPSVIAHKTVVENNEEKFKEKIKTRNGLTTFSNTVHSDIWDNVCISAVNNGGESFICLTVNKVRFLLCPSGGDAYSLSGDWKTSAIAIYGDIPDNDSMIKSKLVLLSMDGKNLSNNVSKLINEGKKVITTYDNDGVLIDCIKDNEISIYRN